jgi:DNA processing protein
MGPTSPNSSATTWPAPAGPWCPPARTGLTEPRHAAPRPAAAGHAGLFDQIAASGLLVSPWPPGTTPTRTQFAVTSRLVATLAAGTVLVEATTRSTSLRALDQALTLGRPAMVVPGPVTSALSAGPHQALRTYRQARLVRGAADVIAELVPPVEDTN